MNKDLQFNKHFLVLILALFMGMGTTWATYDYDFTAVAPSGQTLFFDIISSTDHTVGLVSPNYPGEHEPSVIGDLVIPSTVSYNGETYTVTALLNNHNYGALQETGLTSVVIPETVNNIQGACFYMSVSLTTIILLSTTPPSFSGGWEVDIWATFYGLPSNCVIFVPEGSVESYQAVDYWNDLTIQGINEQPHTIQAVTMPYGCGTISGTGEYDWGSTCTLTATANEGYTFYQWKENGNVVSMENPYSFVAFFNRSLEACFLENSTYPLLYSYNEDDYTATVIGHWDGQNAIGDLVIPAAVMHNGIVYTVTAIGSWAFSECYGLTSVAIPNTVTDIGDHAFYGCRGIEGELVIPNSILSISEGAFEYCGGLTSLNFGTSVTSIGNYAFHGCSSLISLEFPNSMTVIGEWAFYECWDIASVVFPNSLVSLGNWAFRACFELTEVVIPSSVESIGINPFAECSNLAQITVESENVYYDSRDESHAIIETATNTIVSVSLSTVIPNTVTSIGWDAFNGVLVSSITIPASVNYIGTWAIAHINTLSSITVLAEVPPTLDDCTFCEIDKSIPVYVPCGSLEAYQNAGGWNEFENLVVLCPGMITVAANYSEYGTVSGGGSFEGGDTCTVNATANEGYMFICWTDETGLVVSNQAEYTFVVTGDRILTANFMEEGSACELTFYLYDSYGDGWNGNNLVVTSDDGNHEEFTFESGSWAEQTLWIENGSHVALTWINGQYTDECSFAVCYSNGNMIYHGSNLSSDFSFEFDMDCEGMPGGSFDITTVANPEEGGSVTGAGEYHWEETCTLTATANEGYTFMYWTENGEVVSNDAAYSFTVTANRDLVANFALSFTISTLASPAEGGTVSEGGLFDYGSNCTVSAVSNEGYMFMYWTDETGLVVSNQAEYTFVVTGDRILTANFMEEGSACELTFYLYDSYGDGWNGNNLVVTSDDGNHEEFTFESGSWAEQTLWIENGSHVALTWINGQYTDECSFAVCYSNGNMIYHGSNLSSDFSFEFDMDCEGMPGGSFDITTVANPEEGGSVTGAGEYHWEETCTLTATANEGYIFKSWTIDGEVVSTEPSYIFTVKASVNVTANFEIVYTQELVAGWNWWSTNLNITLDDLKTALVDALGSSFITINSQNNGSTTYNGIQWRGPLNVLDVTQMYEILTITSCEITLTGTPVNPAEHPITIHPDFNWMAFPLRQGMTLTNAFAGFVVNGDMVISQEEGSSTYTNRWRGTLNTLEPGKGYMYKSNVQGDRTFTFPMSTK